MISLCLNNGHALRTPPKKNCVFVFAKKRHTLAVYATRTDCSISPRIWQREQRHASAKGSFLYRVLSLILNSFAERKERKKRLPPLLLALTLFSSLTRSLPLLLGERAAERTDKAQKNRKSRGGCDRREIEQLCRFFLPPSPFFACVGLEKTKKKKRTYYVCVVFMYGITKIRNNSHGAKLGRRRERERGEKKSVKAPVLDNIFILIYLCVRPDRKSVV